MRLKVCYLLFPLFALLTLSAFASDGDSQGLQNQIREIMTGKAPVQTLDPYCMNAQTIQKLVELNRSYFPTEEIEKIPRQIEAGVNNVQVILGKAIGKVSDVRVAVMKEDTNPANVKYQKIQVTFKLNGEEDKFAILALEVDGKYYIAQLLK